MRNTSSVPSTPRTLSVSVRAPPLISRCSTLLVTNTPVTTSGVPVVSLMTSPWTANASAAAVPTSRAVSRPAPPQNCTTPAGAVAVSVSLPVFPKTTAVEPGAIEFAAIGLPLGFTQRTKFSTVVCATTRGPRTTFAAVRMYGANAAEARSSTASVSMPPPFTESGPSSVSRVCAVGLTRTVFCPVPVWTVSAGHRRRFDLDEVVPAPGEQVRVLDAVVLNPDPVAGLPGRVALPERLLDDADELRRRIDVVLAGVEVPVVVHREHVGRGGRGAGRRFGVAVNDHRAEDRIDVVSDVGDQERVAPGVAEQFDRGLASEGVDDQPVGGGGPVVGDVLDLGVREVAGRPVGVDGRIRDGDHPPDRAGRVVENDAVLPGPAGELDGAGDRVQVPGAEVERVRPPERQPGVIADHVHLGAGAENVEGVAAGVSRTGSVRCPRRPPTR